jgi:hypothetical protein
MFVLFSRNRYEKLRLRDQLGLTGPKPSFFFGNLMQLISYTKEVSNRQSKSAQLSSFQVGAENAHKFGGELAKKYGKVMGYVQRRLLHIMFNAICRLYFGPELEIVVTDLEIAKEIFIKQFSNFIDRRVSFTQIEIARYV